MSPIDEFRLLTALSFVTGTLVFLIVFAGLVLALRYWRTGGLSVRLAAAGFAVAILTLVAGIVLPLIFQPNGLTVMTPYGTLEETSLWSLVAVQATVSAGTIVSAALIVAALWVAWKRRVAGDDAQSTAPIDAGVNASPPVRAAQSET